MKKLLLEAISRLSSPQYISVTVLKWCFNQAGSHQWYNFTIMEDNKNEIIGLHYSQLLPSGRIGRLIKSDQMDIKIKLYCICGWDLNTHFMMIISMVTNSLFDGRSVCYLSFNTHLSDPRSTYVCSLNITTSRLAWNSMLFNFSSVQYGNCEGCQKLTSCACLVCCVGTY